MRINKIYNILLHPVFVITLGFILLSFVSFLAPIGNDEGTWGYIGRIWVHNGQAPYIGAVENKTPAIFILYAISHALFGANIWFPRLLAILFSTLTAVFIYRFTSKIAGRRAAIFATTIFVLLMPLPSLDGPYAETETFMNLFLILAFYTTLIASEKNRHRSWWLVIGGIWWGLAVAFKQIAVLDIFPLIFLSAYWVKGKIKIIIGNIAWLCLGALLATLFSVLPLLFSSVTITDYINGAWTILFKSNIIISGIVSRLLRLHRNFFSPDLYPLSIGVMGFIIFRKKLKAIIPLVWPLLIWVLTDFIAYNIQGQYFPHHNKIFLLSFSIVFGVVASFILSKVSLGDSEYKPAPAGSLKHENDQKILFICGLIILFVFFIPFQPDYIYSLRSELKGLADNSPQKLGLLVKSVTKPQDYIYVWGAHGGPVYYYSDRMAPSRYFNDIFLGRDGAVAEVKNILLVVQPKLILVPIENPPAMWLDGIIKSNYYLDQNIYGYDIYKRK